MKGKKIKETRSWIKEHTYKRAPLKRHLCAWPIGPPSTKEASNKPAENRDRRLIFNSMSYNFQIFGKFFLGHAKS